MRQLATEPRGHWWVLRIPSLRNPRLPISVLESTKNEVDASSMSHRTYTLPTIPFAPKNSTIFDCSASGTSLNQSEFVCACHAE